MNKFKRLYFDLEVSPNIMFSWSAGYKLNLPFENIIQERAIICICYKWEHENKVHSLEWKKGDDKKLLQDFIKIMNEADECIAHNGDKFDIKWLKTRCLYHKISTFPSYNSVDTLKLAKSNFRFNSNKLDYIGQFLGLGKKKSTGFGLWKDIVLLNDNKAMSKMISYCKQDVNLLAKVYKELAKHVKHKTHVAVYNGGSKVDCPECTSTNTQSRGYYVLASGVRRNKCQCLDCGKWYSVAATTYNKEIKERNRKDKI